MTMRVADTTILGREGAALAEDATALRLVREQFDRLLFTVEGARSCVRSKRAKVMLRELEEGIADLNHDACVHRVTDDANEAAQQAVVRLVEVRK